MPFYDETNFSPGSSVGYLLKRNFRFCSEALASVFDAEGLTYTQWQALIAIHFGRAATGAELADDLAHDTGATTRLIDTLEQRGWVTRTRDQADRRCVRLALTEAGNVVAGRARARLIECWNTWLADWDHSDIETLIGLLQRLERTMGDAVNGPSRR